MLIFVQSIKNVRMLEAFKKYLDSKGIKIQNEFDTTINFERNGLQYIFFSEKSDPYYFRVILPNILKVTPETETDILNLVNTVNLKYKVAKSVIIDNKDVWISVELFVYSMNNIDELFNRVFILHEAVLNEYKEFLKNK